MEKVNTMSLARKIEEVLKNELKPESIRTVIEMAEFLKYKENQKLWLKINESEHEYITDDEQSYHDKIKTTGEFISQEELLKELGINQDEI